MQEQVQLSSAHVEQLSTCGYETSCSLRVSLISSTGAHPGSGAGCSRETSPPRDASAAQKASRPVPYDENRITPCEYSSVTCLRPMAACVSVQPQAD